MKGNSPRLCAGAGKWSSIGGGLSPLPAWVWTHRRVRRWVQAKLVFNRLRMDAHSLTYVA